MVLAVMRATLKLFQSALQVHEFHVFISSYCFYWFLVVSMLAVKGIHDRAADSGFNPSSGLHLKMISTIYGVMINPQLVEHRTSIAEVRDRV